MSGKEYNIYILYIFFLDHWFVGFVEPDSNQQSQHVHLVKTEMTWHYHRPSNFVDWYQ